MAHSDARQRLRCSLPTIESGVDLSCQSTPIAQDSPELPPLTLLRRFSSASSGHEFAEPAQILVFLDWDDTLFPCSELFSRRALPRRASAWPKMRIPEELEEQLACWRIAVDEFVSTVSDLSDRLVIVTNSRSPWVQACVNFFAPSLKRFFCAERAVVAYAGEVLQAKRKKEAKGRCPTCVDCCRGLVSAVLNMEEDELKRTAVEDLTAAKLEAMRGEAQQFYSRYANQTWKNIVSLGDMPYEQDAVKALAASRVATQAREKLRTKTVVTLQSPTLRELTLQLRLWKLMFSSLAHFDGNVDLHLGQELWPVRTIASALWIPVLFPVQLNVSRGFGADGEALVDLGLDQLERALHPRSHSLDSQDSESLSTRRTQVELSSYSGEELN